MVEQVEPKASWRKQGLKKRGDYILGNADVTQAYCGDRTVNTDIPGIRKGRWPEAERKQKLKREAPGLKTRDMLRCKEGERDESERRMRLGRKLNSVPMKN